MHQEASIMEEIKKVIIVGASSGIGRELAILYARKNNRIGVTARRTFLLEELKQQFPDNIFVKSFDNTTGNIEQEIHQLIKKIEGCDLLILSSGEGQLNPDLNYLPEKETIALNVVAWTRICVFIFNFFKTQRYGHLVSITSIASIRGEGRAPAYNASKSFQANYLEGLRKNALKFKLS